MLPRMATGDIRLGGAHIKKGDWVLFGITAANSDPKVFPDPANSTPARQPRTDQLRRGVHFCLGMHLARRELETAMRVVFRTLSGYPVEAGGEVSSRRRRAAGA